MEPEDGADAEGAGRTTLSGRSIALKLADINVNAEHFEVGLVAAGLGQSLAVLAQIIVFLLGSVLAPILTLFEPAAEEVDLLQ